MSLIKQDAKLFAALALAKSKYRRFSRPISTGMYEKAANSQEGLNCNRKGCPIFRKV